MATNVPRGKEARDIFFKAVQFVIGNWPAVRLAVEQGYVGHYGREKERWLHDVVFSLFLENEIIDSLDVEDYLAEILSTEFNVLIEDESLPKVSQMLCNYYQSCMNGDFARINAEIDSIQLPKINVRYEEANGDDGMDESEHGMVTEQLQDLNIRAGPSSSGDSLPEQTASEADSMNHEMNDEDDPDGSDGQWVVVQRSKKKH